MPPMVVLIVDDNSINLAVAAGLLSKFGCSVDTANDGVEALEQAKSKPYDLILMDCQMPRMDGFEATRQIKAFHQPNQGPRIIAVTAHPIDEVQKQAFAAGMEAVISKPLSRESLRRIFDHSGSASAPIVDEKAFFLVLGNDPELACTAVLRFLEEIDETLPRLKIAVESGDAEATAKIAHKMKGMCSLFAAHPMIEACHELETIGREKRMNAAAARLVTLIALNQRFKLELKNILNVKKSKKDAA
jgi:CheY-like chemotaxis protein/HPt (histidine-containing phosphotransfer) domain-containing protein